MTLLHHRWIIAQSAAKSLKRICPACGKSQTAPPSAKGKPMVCKHCGKPVPPPRQES